MSLCELVGLVWSFCVYWTGLQAVDQCLIPEAKIESSR